MEIKLPVSELKTALTGLAKVLNRRSSLPVLQHVHLSRSHAGVLKLQLTDLHTFVAYQFQHHQPGQAGALLLPYERLAQVIKDCGPTDQITLRHHEAGLSLGYPLAGRQVEQVLRPLSLFEWPVVPVVDTPAEPLTADLKAAIGKALACCSTETSRAAIGGAWLDVTDAQAHYVMGTNGRHLFAANSFTLDLPEPLLLPASKFLTWSGFTEDGDWKLAVQPKPPADGSTWFQLQSDHWTFLTQRQKHTMPNWRQVVPASGSSRVTVRFNEAARVFLAEVLPQLPGKEVLDQPLRLEIAAGKLTVTAWDHVSGHPTTLPVDHVAITGPDFTITLNRTFLTKAMKWGLTVLELTDDLSPLVFSTPGQRLVAMPLRHEAAAQAAPTSPTTTPEPPPKEITMTKTTPETVAETTAEPTPVNRLAALTPTTKPTVRTVIEQIDTLRDTLKGVTRQCGEVVEALRTLEKEQRTNDREVAQFREKLRAIQHVTL